MELHQSVAVSTFLQRIRGLDLKLEDVCFESDGGMEADSRAVLLTVKTPRALDHRMIRNNVRKLEGVLYLEEL